MLAYTLMCLLIPRSMQNISHMNKRSCMESRGTTITTAAINTAEDEMWILPLSIWQIRKANSQKQSRWKIHYSYHPQSGTFSFFTSCFRIAESRLKHNALQHGPRSLRRLARSSFRSKAAMLRAPSSCSKRPSASFNQNKHVLSLPEKGKCQHQIN